MSLPSPGPDSTAVVTGASSGIGEQFARELARRGHHVTLVARTADKLQQLAGELSNTGADVLPADLADAEARADAARPVSTRYARHPDQQRRLLDARAGSEGRSRRRDAGCSRSTSSPLPTCAAASCPAWCTRKRGAVLNVASTAAFQPLPGQAGYAAAKAFVLCYTQSLAGELRGTGVTATVLCPGPGRHRTSPTRPASRRKRPKRHCRVSCGNPPRWSPAAASTRSRADGWSPSLAWPIASPRGSPG